MGAKRVLICDDEPAVGRLVKAIAEPLGYEVTVVTGGEELQHAYEPFAPTMIILDMVMPGIDGNEVIAWLAKRGCTARLVVMTGYHPDYADHAKILAEYKGLGPVKTLHKPIDIRTLRSVLKEG
jgi:CheY-like chemotaxis protein